MNKGIIAWRLLLAALIAALLAGCAGSRVSSREATHDSVPLDRLLIVYRYATFGGDGVPVNSAGSMGNRKLEELVPHLYSRLPLAFQAQGVRARMVSEDEFRMLEPAPGEMVLWIEPARATLGTVSGQNLYLAADLVDPAGRQTLWRGRLQVATPGLGQFDEKVAEGLGRQIVQQLRAGRVVAFPATSSGGFAAIDDVDAIPYLNERGRQDYRDWLRRGTPRAFALSEGGHWYSSSGMQPSDQSLPKDPSARALLMCERAARKPCKLYAVNGSVVWRGEPRTQGSP